MGGRNDRRRKTMEKRKMEEKRRKKKNMKGERKEWKKKEKKEVKKAIKRRKEEVKRWREKNLKMRIGTINVTGLYSEHSMRKLHEYILNRKVHIWVLTETHLKKGSEILFDNIFENRYQVIHNSRKRISKMDNGSGGVTILIDKNIKWKNKPKEMKNRRNEGMTWIYVETQDKKMNICGVYIVPKSSNRATINNTIIDEIYQITAIEEKGATNILIGDFNARIGQLNSITDNGIYKRKNKDKDDWPQGRQVLKMCNDANMIITTGIERYKRGETKTKYMETEFTFQTKHGASTIDHCIINEEDLHLIEETVIDDDIWEYINTSHKAVIIKPNITINEGKKEKGKKKRERKERKINKIKNKRVWKKFKEKSEEMNEIDVESRKILMTNDTEENWEGVKKIFEKLNEKVKEIDKKEGELEILKLQKEVEIDREKEETRRRRKRWRKKIRKEKNVEKRNEYTKEYKRMKNREKNLSIKQRKVKQKIEAEIIEELCKEYEGIAWEWLKRLIPKRKKKKQELQEVIDQEGNIKGKDEIMQV